jgi:hypothetical protein
MMINLSDNGGRRLEGDRRQLTDLDYGPERRSGFDRRIKGERRSLDLGTQSGGERRVIYELLSA